MIISNIKSDNINNIRRACIDLSKRIGKDVNQRVSFDVAQIKGKAFMSVQNLMTEKNKGIFLKLSPELFLYPFRGKKIYLLTF